jgi:hypothetical protein
MSEVCRMNIRIIAAISALAATQLPASALAEEPAKSWPSVEERDAMAQPHLAVECADGYYLIEGSDGGLIKDMERPCNDGEQPQAPEEEPTGFELWAWYSSHELPSLDVDQGQQRGLYERLRGRVNLSYGEGQVFLEADLLTGQLGGDPASAQPERANTGTLPRTDVLEQHNLVGLIDPRAAFIGYTTPVGLLRVGMQRNDWGLGILANGGGAKPDQLFNQPFGGDRVIRALFATTPLAAIEGFDAGKNLYLALGADLVWRDENADLLEGDEAYQGVVSAFFRDEATTIGFFGVGRSQTDRDGATLGVIGLDGAFSHTWSTADDSWDFNIAGELAWLGGDTTRTLPQTGGARKTELSGIGAAAEIDADHRPSGVGMKLLGGWASGDANADDDTQYRFRFDPNYKVGLILFDSYMPSVSRANYRGVTNLNQQGQSPRGVENLISEGGVENAYYIQPQLSFGAPDGLMTGIALLYAVSDKPVTDLYKSFAQGGTPAGPFGRREAARELGTEVDVAVQYRFAVWRELTAQFKGEYGVLFPGEAFEDAGGNSASPQSLLRARVALSW